MLQKERLIEVERTLSQIWEEMCLGYIDEELLQQSVYVQIFANRINHKLNEVANDTDDN